MTFTDEEIEIRPGYQTRHWQSCDYFVRGQALFHERAYVRTRPIYSRGDLTPAEVHWLAGGAFSTEQWVGGLGLEDEIETLASRHGGVALEEFYPPVGTVPLYFLAFNDTEKALAFCRTEDFDRLALTLEKLPAV